MNDFGQSLDLEKWVGNTLSPSMLLISNLRQTAHLSGGIKLLTTV